MDLNSFKDCLTEVYQKQFINRTWPHLNKIQSLFKPEYPDYTEGSHSVNRRKYFEPNRIVDIVKLVSSSFPEIANKNNRLKIIDLGCGFGEFSSIFRRFGHTVLSVNGGSTWYLDDFRYVCQELLDLNYIECDLFDLKPTEKYDFVFASEILTLESLIDKSNEVLEHLFSIANNVIVICHKGKVLNYDETRFFPRIHRALADQFNIITFYSDERYQELAENLVNSGKKYGYHINAIPIKNVKLWGKAVAEKPRLIHKYYTKFGSPLVYLDADCEIIKPLDGLLEIIKTNDICIRERNLRDKYNLGVMGFGTNKQLVPFLAEWTNLTKQSLGTSQTVDQKPFENLLVTKYRHLKVNKLHAHYNFLPADNLEYSKDRAVILHHKESKSNPIARAWRNRYYRQEL